MRRSVRKQIREDAAVRGGGGGVAAGGCCWLEETMVVVLVVSVWVGVEAELRPETGV